MASEDEEDLEALRNAVLASMKTNRSKSSQEKEQTPEDDELTALRRAALLSKKSRSDTSLSMVPGPDNRHTSHQHQHHNDHHHHDYRGRRNYSNNSYSSRGRSHSSHVTGNHRNSNLVVINTLPMEGEQPKSEPTIPLIRPQDKWLGSDDRSGTSTPTSTKTKVVDKFSRYESNSEEENQSSDDEENVKDSKNSISDVSSDSSNSSDDESKDSSSSSSSGSSSSADSGSSNDTSNNQQDKENVDKRVIREVKMDTTQVSVTIQTSSNKDDKKRVSKNSQVESSSVVKSSGCKDEIGQKSVSDKVFVKKEEVKSLSVHAKTNDNSTDVFRTVKYSDKPSSSFSGRNNNDFREQNSTRYRSRSKSPKLKHTRRRSRSPWQQRSSQQPRKSDYSSTVSDKPSMLRPAYIFGPNAVRPENQSLGSKSSPQNDAKPETTSKKPLYAGTDIPDYRSKSPGNRSKSPHYRSRSPNHRDKSPYYRSRSPNHRDMSPQQKARSGHLKTRSPVHSDLSPKRPTTDKFRLGNTDKEKKPDDKDKNISDRRSSTEESKAKVRRASSPVVTDKVNSESQRSRSPYTKVKSELESSGSPRSKVKCEPSRSPNRKVKSESARSRSPNSKVKSESARSRSPNNSKVTTARSRSPNNSKVKTESARSRSPNNSKVKTESARSRSPNNSKVKTESVRSRSPNNSKVKTESVRSRSPNNSKVKTESVRSRSPHNKHKSPLQVSNSQQKKTSSKEHFIGSLKTDVIEKKKRMSDQKSSLTKTNKKEGKILEKEQERLEARQKKFEKDCDKDSGDKKVISLKGIVPEKKSRSTHSTDYQSKKKENIKSKQRKSSENVHSQQKKSRSKMQVESSSESDSSSSSSSSDSDTSSSSEDSDSSSDSGEDSWRNKNSRKTEREKADIERERRQREKLKRQRDEEERNKRRDEYYKDRKSGRKDFDDFKGRSSGSGKSDRYRSSRDDRDYRHNTDRGRYKPDNRNRHTDGNTDKKDREKDNDKKGHYTYRNWSQVKSANSGLKDLTKENKIETDINGEKRSANKESPSENTYENKNNSCRADDSDANKIGRESGAKSVYHESSNSHKSFSDRSDYKEQRKRLMDFEEETETDEDKSSKKLLSSFVSLDSSKNRPQGSYSKYDNQQRQNVKELKSRSKKKRESENSDANSKCFTVTIDNKGSKDRSVVTDGLKSPVSSPIETDSKPGNDTTSSTSQKTKVVWMEEATKDSKQESEKSPSKRLSIHERLGRPVHHKKAKITQDNKRKTHQLTVMRKVEMGDDVPKKTISATDVDKQTPTVTEPPSHLSDLDARILLIKKKNAEILRRQAEIAQDKEKYG